ncbi:MAG: type II toxin-antitoxin system RelE/ParE family toxin [Pseudomonadota bacterium]
MRRDVRLLPRAVRKLEQIDEWTQAQFGARQAERYLGQINARLLAVADGDAHIRQLSSLTGDDRHSAIVLLRAGEHFLILDLRRDVIRVVDIVHTRSDLMQIVPTDREKR